jgi:stage III sporulation protein AF
MAYIKSYLILFVILSLLIAMVPGERMKHYIRFFAGIVMAAGILESILSLYAESDSMMGQIAYESFAGELSEVQRDIQRVEFAQNEIFLREYEAAVSEEISRIAETVTEQYGCQLEQSAVSLKEDYTVEQIVVTLGQNAVWQDGMAEEIREIIADYYELDTAVIRIEGGKDEKLEGDFKE